VEYFLDSHVDEYKKEVYFQPGDIVLDPFCGSGTTLVQANELNEHALGIDISSFNSLVTNIKVRKHDLKHLSTEINRISQTLSEFNSKRNIKAFESKLLFELAKFNSKYFPSPSYKKQIREGLINEFEYSRTKELEFLDTFNTLIKNYRISNQVRDSNSFLEKWFLPSVLEEIEIVRAEILKINDSDLRDVLTVILSRTVRSCRATTHADLGTLVEPVTATYYCKNMENL